jgi:hypothetical protein
LRSPSLELSQRVLDAIGDRVGIRYEVNAAVIGESRSGEFDVNVGVLEIEQMHFFRRKISNAWGHKPTPRDWMALAMTCDPAAPINHQRLGLGFRNCPFPSDGNVGYRVMTFIHSFTQATLLHCTVYLRDSLLTASRYLSALLTHMQGTLRTLPPPCIA